MQRSLRRGQDTGSRISQTDRLHGNRRRTHIAGERNDVAPLRLIGLPIASALPKLKGVRTHYCNRWDEQPAARLAASMLRLGIATSSDFAGSAVAMVNRALVRLCKQNGGDTINKSLECCVGFLDVIEPMSEYQRVQADMQVAEGDVLYFRVEYPEASIVPMRSALTLLEEEHELLPAALFLVMNSALSSFMQVYSILDAEQYVEMMEEESDPEEENEDDGTPLYKYVINERPESLRPAIRQFIEKLTKKQPIDLVRRFSVQAKNDDVRMMLRLICEAWDISKAFADMELMTERVRECFYEMDYSNPIEGTILCWEPHDSIHELFDQDSQSRAQGSGFFPFACLEIDMLTDEAALDARVLQLMNFVKGMGQTLERFCNAREIIWKLHERENNDRKKRRLQSQ
jgi:hypothetical protein